MKYQEALNYLAGLGKFGIHLGLERITGLLTFLDHPEKKFKSIHVTGTNGKGSTCAMLEAILRSAGLKTALYTSPHLVSYTERMVLDGSDVSEADFALAIAAAKAAVEKMAAADLEHPTEFEVITAAAFWLFAEKKVEYAVVEVGLGGLLDSTNVIVPELSLITNISLEHTDRCGSTLEEIAAVKAGIIKEGVPVITAAQPPALAVIEETARRKKSALKRLGQEFSVVGGWESAGQRIRLTLDGDVWPEFSLALLGRNQLDNAALAMTAAALLAEREPRITRAAIATGLKAARWPGRFERIAGQPEIIIDGAHNPAGARCLRANLDELEPQKPRVFLLGILADKDVAGILGALIRPEDRVVVVPPASERAASPEAIAAQIKARQVVCCEGISRGLKEAKTMAGPDELLCVAGSLYLVGTVRSLLGL